ncbi:hypothetical protein CI610_01463 [invertebrate metagenome]|uniref:HicA protein n=1 Tax=invertebrate metagenome TaxID=1711999 RepID=A0A2H9T8U0_9ZZZZ
MDKYIKRLLSKPKDLTVGDLRKALGGLGFEFSECAGSRLQFAKGNIKIKIHRPHPNPVIKRHQLQFIVRELKNNHLVPVEKDYQPIRDGRHRCSVDQDLGKG